MQQGDRSTGVYAQKHDYRVIKTRLAHCVYSFFLFVCEKHIDIFGIYCKKKKKEPFHLIPVIVLFLSGLQDVK